MTKSQSILLDLLRILAVQMVVIGHALSYFNIAKVAYIQNSGVVLFFILSGTVISYSLFQKNNTGKYRFRDFFIDRFSRIYSGLIPALCFIVFIDLSQIYILNNQNYSFYSSFNIQTLIGNLLMMQDFPILPYLFNGDFIITSFASGLPLWTLGVEWWLYMSFGMLMLKYYKKFNTIYLPILLLFMIVPLSYAYMGRGSTLTLFWIEGIIITVIVLKNKKSWSKVLAYLFLIISLFLAFQRLVLTTGAYDLVYVTFLSLSIGSALVITSFNARNYEKTKKVTHFIAGYTFTLYLIHYSIYDFLSVINKDEKSFIMFLFAIILSNLLSLLIAYYTEMRYKKLRYFIHNKLSTKESCVK